MRVLGLDPGLTCAGYGLVERTNGKDKAIDFGAIRTPKVAVPARLRTLHAEIEALIATHRPDAVAVERVLFNTNARTAMATGQAAGVALLAASKAGCEIAEYTANEVKLSVAGDGSAPKLQVQRMIARLLELDEVPTPADAADALGLALTHIYAYKLKGIERSA